MATNTSTPNQILNNTGGSESVSDLSVGLSDIGGPTQGQNKQVTIINWITLGNGETPPSDGTANGGPPLQNVIWDFPGNPVACWRRSSTIAFHEPVSTRNGQLRC